MMHNAFCRAFWAVALALAMTASGLPQPARAADAGASQEVSCKLPGEIHSVGGHSMMGAGRIVQTSPADCRQRGGEYTLVDAPASISSPASPSSPATAEDRRIVSCLLPPETRQLGEKVRYKHARHSIRTTRADCERKGGKVYVPRKGKAGRK